MFPSSYACPLQKAARRRFWLTQICENPYCRAVIKQTVKKYGLSHYLSGQMELDDVSLPEPTSTISILFLQDLYRPTPVSFWEAMRSKICWKSCRMQYDYVIVDTPPLAASSTARLQVRSAMERYSLSKAEPSATNLLRM